MSLYPKLHDLIFSILGGKREVKSEVMPWHFGTSESAAATIAKTATLDNFSLRAGVRLSMQFANDNTGASPTLNVNGTGAYPIQFDGEAVVAGRLKAGKVYDMTFSGSAWEITGGLGDPTPPGVCYYYMGEDVPEGYLICNGAWITKAEYPDLFDVLSTWSELSSDGASVQLPDGRDKFFMGAGTNSLGAGISASLPEITGSIQVRKSLTGANEPLDILGGNPSGAFDVDLDAGTAVARSIASEGISYERDIFSFTASGSNSIYSGSTVQPPAVVSQFIIRA